MGIFAINRTADVSRKTDALSINYFPSVLALARVQANLHRSVSLLLQLIASSDEQRIRQLDGQIKVLQAADDKDIQFYESTPFTPEEARIYADSKTTRARFLEIFSEVHRVGQSTDAKEIARAQQIFAQQLSPVFEKYSDDVLSLVDINKAGADRGMGSIQQTVASTNRGMIIGIIL